MERERVAALESGPMWVVHGTIHAMALEEVARDDDGSSESGTGRRDAETLRGELRFVSRDEAVRLRGALDAARLLVVSPCNIGPGSRGKLAEVIDDALEAALRDRGGAPPGIGAASDADAALSDQLYRARQVGRVGLAIDLGALTALVDVRGALEPDDGACLRFLAQATRDRPLVVMLDGANATIRMYGAPQPLGEALGLIPSAPPVGRMPGEDREPKQRERRPMPTRTSTPLAATNTVRRVPTVDLVVEREPQSAEEEVSASALMEAVSLLRNVTRATPLTGLERAFVDGYAPLRAALLDEKLGCAGLVRSDVRSLCASFTATFARAYAEALPTFGVTGRHPHMVFELFDLAQRCARVHGARSTHVVIVDSLRWDLGKRLRERMGKTLSRRAVCVEEQVMWALLPTTTSVQLDAITRGDDALRAPVRPEHETSIVRGRSLDVLRRMRLGHRDLVKLDLIEGRLRDAGCGERERLDGLADEIAPIVSRYVSSSPTRALVVVAGDHGFAFGAHDEPQAHGAHADDKGSTPAARQGGGSPDEVFVPFTAWLVGGVH